MNEAKSGVMWTSNEIKIDTHAGRRIIAAWK